MPQSPRITCHQTLPTRSPSSSGKSQQERALHTSPERDRSKSNQKWRNSSKKSQCHLIAGPHRGPCQHLERPLNSQTGLVNNNLETNLMLDFSFPMICGLSTSRSLNPKQCFGSVGKVAGPRDSGSLQLLLLGPSLR